MNKKNKFVYNGRRLYAVKFIRLRIGYTYTNNAYLLITRDQLSEMPITRNKTMEQLIIKKNYVVYSTKMNEMVIPV